MLLIYTLPLTEGMVLSSPKPLPLIPDFAHNQTISSLRHLYDITQSTPHICFELVLHFNSILVCSILIRKVGIIFRRARW